jgi:Xaa-Pro aminopeptidase
VFCFFLCVIIKPCLGFPEFFYEIQGNCKGESQHHEENERGVRGFYNNKNRNGHRDEQDDDVELDGKAVKLPSELGFCFLIHCRYVYSGIKVLDVSRQIYIQMDPLSEAIRKSGTDAYIVYANSRDADMRYLTHFTTSDPFVFFKRAGEKGTIIISQMEVGRASREGITAVMTRAEAGLPDILKKEKDTLRATARMIADQAGKKILVPPNFPIALANALGKFSSITVDKGTVLSMRAKKTRTEIRYMKDVQQVTQTAMMRAFSLLKRSRPRKGILYLDNKPLTSELIKYTMHCVLLEHGCCAEDTIVSCGEDTATPHITGTGPLRADEPIVIDLFPVHEKSGYFADMTRTFVKGEPSQDIREMYTALREAKQLSITRVKNGISGSDLYQVVVDFFKDQGYDSDTRGFVHNLGHGVGLQVHELPTVGPSGRNLETGNVITIEPGLYYPGIGGVRLEDIGAVTKTGFDNFTLFPEDLVV